METNSERPTIKFATMTYTQKNSKILMVEKYERPEDPNSEFYTLPGGKLEDYEKGGNQEGRLESAIRETLDETGIEILEANLIGIVTFNNFERNFKNYKNPPNFEVYIFETQDFRDSELRPSDEGIPRWTEKSEIKNLPKNAGDEKLYEWIEIYKSQKKKFFVGVIKHIGNEIDEKETWVDFV